MAKRKPKTKPKPKAPKPKTLTPEEALEQASQRMARVYQARIRRERKLNPDYGMLFESTMRLLFGDEAFHIAGYERNPKWNRSWLVRAIKRCMKEVNVLDTSDRHRERLLVFLKFALNHARKAVAPEPLAYCLLATVILQLGFADSGRRIVLPMYVRTELGFSHTLEALAERQEARRVAVQKRREIIRRLRAEGHDTFEISLILKTSEHDVKKQLAAARGKIVQ